MVLLGGDLGGKTGVNQPDQDGKPGEAKGHRCQAQPLTDQAQGHQQHHEAEASEKHSGIEHGRGAGETLVAGQIPS